MATGADCDNCRANELKGQVRVFNHLTGVAHASVSVSTPHILLPEKADQ